MTEMTTLLEARALSRRYGEVTALESLNLRVGAGEVFCMLDTGKTATIRLFLGFLSPSSGQALINGVDVAESRSSRSARSLTSPSR
jgi:ABC-2 type transport system ATP-binding protein